MLRVIIEILPQGDETKKETLSVLDIWNTGRVDEYQEYTYEFEGFWKDTNGETRKIFKDRVVFDRRKMYWLLIHNVTHKILKPFFYIKE